MKTNWAKIRNQYINGTMSTRELSIKYGVSHNLIKKKCAEEHWVEQRKVTQAELGQKLAKKTVENIVEKEAACVARLSNIYDTLLDSLETASKELKSVMLKDRKSKQHTTYALNKRDVVTETDTSTMLKEEVRVQEVEIVDVAKLQRLVSMAGQIASAYAMLQNTQADPNAEESDIVKALRDAYTEVTDDAAKS